MKYELSVITEGDRRMTQDPKAALRAVKSGMRAALAERMRAQLLIGGQPIAHGMSANLKTGEQVTLTGAWTMDAAEAVNDGSVPGALPPYQNIGGTLCRTTAWVPLASIADAMEIL